MSKRRSYAPDDGVAIIGMACIFPGARNLTAFRENVESGVDAIRNVPSTRWDARFYDPSSESVADIYCRRGGFIEDGIAFDPSRFGIMPVAAAGAEPDQMLALLVAVEALENAGYPEVGALPRATTGIILGRGGYLGARGASAFQRARTAPQLMDVLRVLIPELSEARLEQVRTEFCARLEPYGPDTAIGLVPNIIASRIANRLDFQGPAYTVDAACASALVAVDHGIRELGAGRCDLVIAGGVHVVDDLSFWNVFSRLGAISRSQQIRPFDRRADGLLIGEGIGLVVLKRMPDAVRDADRVYAVIRGAGVASDGREASVMLPRVEGQLLALERAWSDAGLDPGTIGLLEAHGTGTPTGDATELATVARFFADRLTAEPGLGSVKSMIGHAMPAAGAAGLIKAALAVYHGVLPPTLHCDEPHERFAATGFRLLRGREPWDSRGAPRRAGVNAFGFGGINAHVILEEAPPASEAVAPRARAEGASREEVVFLAAEQVGALQEALASGRGAGSGPCRLVMSDPSRERRELAAKILARGKRWDGRNGIWFAPRGLAFDGGKVAFLCPGFDGRFEPRIGDLERHFGVSFPTVATGGSDLMGAGLGIVNLGHALDGILRNLRLRPDVVAGHSIGEWTGMWVAGMQAEEEAARFAREILPSLTLDVPGVAFAALACGLEAAQEAVSGLPEIAVSHDNCPHQTVLCGVDASIDAATGRLRERKIFCEKLSFRSGFHSPLFAGYLEPFTENFASFSLQPATVPLWSATTVGPYPDAPEAIRQLFREHLISPVRFRELVERLYEEGVRVFVQLGVGRLPGFVRDTLHGRPHVAVAAHAENRSAMEQLRRLAMQLWCDGYELDLEPLGFDPAVVGTACEGSAIPLTLSATLGTVETPLELARPSAASDSDLPKELAATAVGAELAATQRSLDSMRAEIAQVWQDRRAERPAGKGERSAGVLRQVRHFSVGTVPELIDHCFIRQPPDWPDLSDRFPVVPMTYSLDLMLELARKVAPGKVPVALERVRAERWLEAEPGVDVEMEARFDGKDRARVEMGNYNTGTVVLADAYPAAPAPSEHPVGPNVTPWLTLDEYYRDRWAFHGPSYQGVASIDCIGREGVHGTVRALPARGSLLDAAGQVAGYWHTAHTTENRLALPFRIDRIRFFGAPPPVGEELDCRVGVRELTDVWMRFDMDLLRAGRVWARVEGWEDRRFESNERMRQAWLYPECNAYGEITDGGYCDVREGWRSTASRYFVSRGYLNGEERERYLALSPLEQRAWLLGRIAIKDGVRQWMWKHGYGNVYPVEIAVGDDNAARPRLRGPFAEDLRVSVAAVPDRAVALIAEGQDPGIDIEPAEGGGAEVEDGISAAERSLLPEEKREEGVARLRAAKHAVARARGARGSVGDLKLAEVADERLKVDGIWVETRRSGECVVAWTCLECVDSVGETRE